MMRNLWWGVLGLCLGYGMSFLPVRMIQKPQTSGIISGADDVRPENSNRQRRENADESRSIEDLRKASVTQLRAALDQAMEEREKYLVDSRFDSRYATRQELESRAEEAFRAIRSMRELSTHWICQARFRRGDGSEFQWKMSLKFYDMNGSIDSALNLSSAQVNSGMVAWILSGYPLEKGQYPWIRSAGLGNLSVKSGKFYYVGEIRDEKGTHLAIPFPVSAGAPVEYLSMPGQWVTGEPIEWTAVSAEEYKRFTDAEDRW